jgi:hypothetical protein
MKQSRLPPGWNQGSVDRVLQHYESQTEDDAVAEDEDALFAPGQTIMEIPSALVPMVRELIARHNQQAPGCAKREG